MSEIEEGSMKAEMRTRIYNARILTMEPGRKIFFGEIGIEDGRIISVREEQGKEKEQAEDGAALEKGNQKGQAWDEEIDARGNLVMPGFKNAHTHSAMTFLRSFADDLPLSEWLEKQVFPMEARLEKDDIYYLSKLAVMEYLTSGITANFDMYFQPRQIAQASVDCGFRTVIAGTMNNFTSSLEQEEENYVELNRFHPLVQYRLGFHAEYTTSPELLKGLSRLAEKYSAPVFCHNSETRSEVEQCLERNHATPTVFMEHLGMFALLFLPSLSDCCGACGSNPAQHAEPAVKPLTSPLRM